MLSDITKENFFIDFLFFVLIKIGRRNYRYFFQFLFLLCIHMIFVTIFCSYYVLNERHRVLLNSHVLMDSEDSIISIDENEIPTTVTSQRKFVGFSDYRFTVSLVLLIALGLFFIPVFGLTGFHVFLIAKGRTTNEQVTKKYLDQGDVFTKGLIKNFAYLFCQPLIPQLKAPATKQYNVELFEKMAYETHPLPNGKKKQPKKPALKVTYQKINEDNEKQPKRKKRKPTHHDQKARNPVPNVYVNPINERRKFSIGILYFFLYICFHLASKPKTRTNKKPIKIPVEQVSLMVKGYENLIKTVTLKSLEKKLTLFLQSSKRTTLDRYFSTLTSLLL